MVMGVKDGSNTGQLLPDGLRVEVGAGVDKDAVTVIFQANGRASAAVGRAWQVGVETDGARAAESWHAHGGTGAQKRKGRLHS